MKNIKQQETKPRPGEISLSQAIRKGLIASTMFIGLGLVGMAQAATPVWQYLGTNGASGKPYNSSGKPYALFKANGAPNTITNMTDTSIKNELLQKIAQRLPEGQGIGQDSNSLATLTDDQGANLFLTKAARVKVSFIAEGAGYRNSIGFFKFTTAALATVAEPNNDKIMFPDFSSDVLSYGDTVDLGMFAAGDAIGFTIAANGWQSSPSPGKVNTSQPDSMIYRTITRFNPEPNTNNQRAHTILFKYDQRKMLILGMEDLNRTNCTPRLASCASDDDFNDVILAVHVDPWDAVGCLNGQCDQLVVPTCVAPQVLVNNACVTPVPTCTAPQVLQNNVCVTPPPTCVAPQVLRNGVCAAPIVGDSGPISWREITNSTDATTTSPNATGGSTPAQ